MGKSLKPGLSQVPNCPSNDYPFRMNLSQCGKPLIAIKKPLNNMTINGR